MNMPLQTRKDRLIRDNRKDSYREKTSRTKATECSRCGAVYSAGRWTWKKDLNASKKTLCPACRRSIDKLPAGIISLGGSFYKNNKKEILNLIHNIHRLENRLHPMERILELTDNGTGRRLTTTITTTGIHLARRIGEALSRSYSGEYSFSYGDQERTIRVKWERD